MRRFAAWRVLAVGLILSLIMAGCTTVEDTGGQPEEGGNGGGGETGEDGGIEPAQSITGAGATFPAPLYSQMFDALAQDEGIQVNYQSIGSGGGIEQFTDNTTDFGASDAPMTEEQMDQVDSDVLHVATVGGSVVPAYTLEGVEELNLTEQALADIFLGNITTWDDPAIADTNPDANLPSEQIQVVHRSDGSGTTSIFTSYLAAVSDQWESEVGAGTEVAWPVGSGGQGNEGVAAFVNQTPNSLGYVELAYATENDIPFASLGPDADGPFVEASLETSKNAIQEADIPDDLRVTISSTNPIAENAYPIVGLTWLLIRQEMEDPAVCAAVAEAAWFATHEGQKFAPDLQYVQISDNVVQQDEEFINSMESGGQKCYQG